MPNCKKCGTEVDVGQKVCAWCGVDDPAGASQPLGAKKPPQSPAPAPAPAPTPASSAQGSEMKVHKGTGPKIEDARNLAQRGDLDGALSLFHHILETQPNNQEALFGIGGVCFKRNEPRKAIEHWLKLKVLNPDYPNLEGWIQQAKDKLPPPVEKKPAPVAAPSSEGEQDWQNQSVRVSGQEPPKVAAAPKPKPKSKSEAQKSEIDRILEEDDTSVSKTAWVVPAGWGLLGVYVVLIWVLYFSAWIRG